MEFNTYSSEELKSRSELASSLKYGDEAQAMAKTAAVMGARVKDIPFPKGLKPVLRPIKPIPKPDDSLPKVDVVAMMDTAAEAQAMADVLTPGIDRTNWYPYAKNFEKHYMPLIGPHGPSRYSKRLGSYFIIEINNVKVLVYKTELHMHEDAIKLPNGSYTLPIKDMLAQIIKEARPKLFLTTGTSGGVYCDMSLGDVAVSRAARFHCLGDFKNAPFNNNLYKSNWTISKKYVTQAEKLMQSYASHLTGKSEPKGTPPSKNCGCSPDKYPTKIHFDGADGIPEFHPILTTDVFEYGTSTNNLDKLGMAVEMDDAVLGLVCSEMKSPPKWACVRNLSDPTINGHLSVPAQKKCAVYYYQKFGYWTTVMSALTTWGIIAGFGAKS
ncbi:MAG: hypothetical protein ICV60_23045 [Pyrinomonadaceae bacterium]|nr:hypothetical protein [Pyrinomonadaceae bacterium]